MIQFIPKSPSSDNQSFKMYVYVACVHPCVWGRPEVDIGYLLHCFSSSILSQGHSLKLELANLG